MNKENAIIRLRDLKDYCQRRYDEPREESTQKQEIWLQNVEAIKIAVEELDKPCEFCDKPIYFFEDGEVKKNYCHACGRKV